MKSLCTTCKDKVACDAHRRCYGYPNYRVTECIGYEPKDEPTCDTCRHKGVEGCEQPCLGCGCCGLYEAITGNDKLKEKVVEFIKSCARCKHRPIGAMMCEESCHYEPKDRPQTDTEIAKAIVHKMIDDSVIAEDAYPDLRQKMHEAVDKYESRTERSE